VLRVKIVCKEVKKKVERLGNNIRIATLTQAIIKLQMELDKAYNKKRRLGWASELQWKRVQVGVIFEEVREIYLRVLA
jgi:hypothetical protein